MSTERLRLIEECARIATAYDSDDRPATDFGAGARAAGHMIAMRIRQLAEADPAGSADPGLSSGGKIGQPLMPAEAIARRKFLKWGTARLAREARMHQNTVRGYEAGAPTPEPLRRRILRALGLDTDIGD